jgi:ribosomal protein L17
VTPSELFLGVIAVSTLIMAFVQVGAIVTILKVARQTQQTVAELQRDVKPLIAKASTVADEASRTASLVTVQAQKIDYLLTDLTQRFDQTATVVQQAIIGPAREGMAIIAALKAGLMALQGLRDRPRHSRTADEEDPLFIG